MFNVTILNMTALPSRLPLQDFNNILYNIKWLENNHILNLKEDDESMFFNDARTGKYWILVSEHLVILYHGLHQKIIF